MTTKLQLFFNAKIVNNCISSESGSYLPYSAREIPKIFVRNCYKEVFDLLLDSISNNRKNFCISGTPGIGKSLFFIYILHRLLTDSVWKPKRIVYHCETSIYVYDLDEKIVSEFTDTDIKSNLVRVEDSLYVVDGSKTSYIRSTCVTIFISSPRSEFYKTYKTQSHAIEWCLPTWSTEEIRDCKDLCYPDLSDASFNTRFEIYGGVARYVFYDLGETVPKKMENALNDIDAVKNVRHVGQSTDIFPASHTLMHMIVGDDSDRVHYQYLYTDIASRFVGEQLWIRHSKQMIDNLQNMFGGAPNQISGHLFEIYGHRLFASGNISLKAKNLDDGVEFEFSFKSHSEHLFFGKDSIPSSLESNAYYEASDDVNFPAIDSLSYQGMFQFTVAQNHPIRGVKILKSICQLFQNPAIYFVVPKHRFLNFQKQKFKNKISNAEVTPIDNLKQYVIELDVLS